MKNLAIILCLLIAPPFAAPTALAQRRPRPEPPEDPAARLLAKLEGFAKFRFEDTRDGETFFEGYRLTEARVDDCTLMLRTEGETGFKRSGALAGRASKSETEWAAPLGSLDPGRIEVAEVRPGKVWLLTARALKGEKRVKFHTVFRGGGNDVMRDSLQVSFGDGESAQDAGKLLVRVIGLCRGK